MLGGGKEMAAEKQEDEDDDKEEGKQDPGGGSRFCKCDEKMLRNVVRRCLPAFTFMDPASLSHALHHTLVCNISSPPPPTVPLEDPPTPLFDCVTGCRGQEQAGDWMLLW